jgi:hypothetical protein
MREVAGGVDRENRGAVQDQARSIAEADNLAAEPSRNLDRSLM